MGIKSLYRDPYAGRYFKIFLVAFICWIILSGFNVNQKSSWSAGELVKYRVTFFGLLLYSFGVEPGHELYPWFGLIRVPITILSAIAMVTLVFAVVIHVIPEIKKHVKHREL